MATITQCDVCGSTGSGAEPPLPIGLSLALFSHANPPGVELRQRQDACPTCARQALVAQFQLLVRQIEHGPHPWRYEQIEKPSTRGYTRASLLARLSDVLQRADVEDAERLVAELEERLL